MLAPTLMRTLFDVVATTTRDGEATDLLPEVEKACTCHGAEADDLLDALRHQIRHALRNGLAPAIRRLGHKVLIDEIGYRIWLATGQAPGHADD